MISLLARSRIRPGVIFVVLAIISIAAIYSFLPRTSGVAEEEKWVHVQPQLLESQIGLVGRIEAAAQMTLVAPFDGLVENLKAVEGQRIERNQRVLSLNTEQLDIQLREALTELLKAQRSVYDLQNWSKSQEVARARRVVATARMGLSDTNNKLAETLRLFERGIVARMEVDALEQQARAQHFDLSASEAELRSVLNKGEDEGRQIADMEFENAQVRYRALQALISRRDLSAPFAGILLRSRKQDDRDELPSLQDGVQVTRGAPLFDIASIERVKAVAQVQEFDLHQLREGMPVNVTGDGFSGITLQGHIQSIGVQSVPSDTYGGGATYEVIVAVDPLTSKELERVRLGMSARLGIIIYRNQKGFAVSEDALQRGESGETFVFYRKAIDSQLEKIPVTVGNAVPQGVEIFGLKSGYVMIGMSGE
ncbi:efflux RND transporter periplasmic adaptor subunit [Phytopseudomonas daroniae]|uniref:efflux RND transporter periplasmic adaptor subunit n=1 Tax=Phytopseudomonas daroniae TaxID=2487519 RepID=UPI001038515C|nr:HlyD family efflux transporter periplasmic adaptor subunit [Pseudomonas daroniae]TBU73999.1 RND transporter [Pseudomonas daroniae]